MKFFHNYSLQNLNSFNFPAFARYYIPCNTMQDIQTFCTTVNPKDPLYILGGGTNTLFASDFSGYLLHIQLSGIEVIKETSSKVFLQAAAGENWHNFVQFCIERGYGGIENLSLIPGMVGGAVVQNIGAYGVELKDVVDHVETIDLETGRKRIFNRDECAFGYRTSIFKTSLHNQCVISNVGLSLHKTPRFSIEYGDIQKTLEQMEIKQISFKAISEAVIAIRKQKVPDPALLGNAGSFFKNPLISLTQYKKLKKKYPSLVAFSSPKEENLIKISAAWLIEQVGFKGLRQGNVGVYKKHALILVHYGGGRGEEIIILANQIQKKIKDQFNIYLFPEVQIIGKEYS